MSDSFLQANGTSNGTSDQVMITSPAASTTRIIPAIRVNNNDTVEAEIEVFFEEATTEIRLGKKTLQPGDTWTLVGPFHLANTDEDIQCRLSSAVTTDELDYYAAYDDVPQ